MNFIGHASIAVWHAHEESPAPEFVLGSMLPDFAGMARVRMSHPLPAEVPPPLAAGIALHHRTDDAFHGATGFVALQQSALDALTARDVPRGAARAIAHIGVEMLIDGELLADDALARTYLRALEVEVPLAGVFPDRAARDRYLLLRERLRQHGPPHDYRDPDAVLRRLQYVLSTRPRLALPAASVADVRRLLPSVQGEVRSALPALLTSVRDELSRRGRSAEFRS